MLSMRVNHKREEAMLFVTFHGGKDGVNNVYGFSTKDGRLETTAALSAPHHGDVKLDELRGMAICGGNLFVVDGSKNHSSLLVFQGPPRSGPSFDYLNMVIGQGQSIMHPFGVAFEAASLPTHCYVSNQDSNVVARMKLAAGTHGEVDGTLGNGCVSDYLNKLYPAPAQFLDGTFVASQTGNLVNVAVVAPDVSEANGGLKVTGTGSPLQPANSVRDVAVSNGLLFVCDEMDCQINMYDVHHGTYLGSGALNGNQPTHLAINGKGLWVSAGETFWWTTLPTSSSAPPLAFQQVAITAPAKHKIGGISFDDTNHVYVVTQDGTGTKGQGTIQKFIVTAGTPPTLSAGLTFATITDDTPEFCLFVSDSHWPH
jgi:hypothetical protein